MVERIPEMIHLQKRNVQPGIGDKNVSQSSEASKESKASKANKEREAKDTIKTQ
jgi:hypothetical protein